MDLIVILLAIALDQVLITLAMAIDRAEQAPDDSPSWLSRLPLLQRLPQLKQLPLLLLDHLCQRSGNVGLAGVAIGVALLYWLLHRIMPLFGLLLSVAILTASLGLRELTIQVQAYLEGREQEDSELTNDAAAALLEREIGQGEGGMALTGEVLTAVLVNGHARGAGVLFWFLIAGPGGALLYTLAQRMTRQPCEKMDKDWPTPRQWLPWLDWVSVRLTALAYGVAGSLTHAIAAWKSLPKAVDNGGLLVATGSAALLLETSENCDIPPGASLPLQDSTVDKAQALVWRALVAWVAVVALITFGYWL